MSSMIQRLADRYVECQRQASLAVSKEHFHSSYSVAAPVASPSVVSDHGATNGKPITAPVPTAHTRMAGTAAARSDSTDALPVSSGTTAGAAVGCPTAVGAAGAGLVNQWVEWDGLHSEDDAGDVSSVFAHAARGHIPTAAASCSGAPRGKGADPCPHKPRRYLLHGFDVATLDSDSAFILMFSCIILNCDMRSAAIKAKMSRTGFIQRNLSIPALSHIPPSFFAGLHDELALQGLPVGENVPTSPARHALSQLPAPETIAILEQMTAGRHGLASSAPARALAETAHSAVTWLRRSVRSLGTTFIPEPQPVILYRR